MRKVEYSSPLSIHFWGGRMEKPTLMEVLEVVDKKINFFIYALAINLPDEQKDEIRQIARLKIFEKYDEIDPEQNWKGLLNMKLSGIVKDYIKQGTGFEDGEGWKRLGMNDDDGEEISVENVMGARGLFDTIDIERINVNWELVAKLASKTPEFHAFVKQLIGIPLRIIGPVLNVEIARADQLIKEFTDRFDDPHYADDTTAEGFWFRQCCYALGVSELMGWPNEPCRYHDSGVIVGSKLQPVNINSEEPSYNYKLKTAQMGFDLDGKG